MGKGLVIEETDPLSLLKQMIELERQLAEAQDRILQEINLRKQIEGARERLLAEVQQQKEESERLEEAARRERDRAAWLARLPGENPNPVVRASADGIVLYHNPAAGELSGWSCAVDQPLPYQLLPLVERAMAQVQEIQQDVQLGDRIYSISIMPIPGEAYANLYGRDITARKQAELALQDSETRYRRLIENANEGIWTIDADHRTNFINPRGAQILGYTVEEMLGKPALDFVFPEDITYSSQQLADRKKGIGVVHDMRMQHKDGYAIWVSSSTTPIYGASGEYLGALAMFVDITERKQAEQSLRESELFYRQMLESIPGMVFTTRPDGYCDYQSQQWVDYTGVPMSDHLGDGWNKLLHPGDQSRALAAWREAVKDRAPYNLEYRVRRHDGQYEWFKVIGRPIRDASGQIVRWFGVATDIHGLKGTEEALRKSEEHFRQLADAMPQLVWTARPDGTVDYYNRRYLEYGGIVPTEHGSWEWSPVLHPDDLQSTVEAWQQSVKTGEIYQIEHRARMKDGSYRWHLSRGVPVRDEEGRITRWYGTATDIHDQKLTEEKLVSSNRALQEFAYAASHDLQEPLRKIEAFGDLLLKSASQMDGHQRDYLERMRKAAGRLRDMVDGLLQLSRVNTQAQPFIPVDLSQVAAEVLFDLEYQLRHTGGKVEVGRLPQVEGDPLQLHQLLQNLIGNALKYHQPDAPPVVKVYARKLSDSVQILVEDNGIGFDQNEAELMFLPFQRLVGRSQYEGSGMGLAICKRIIERHGGEITAMGKPGVGSSFIVTLPINGE